MSEDFLNFQDFQDITDSSRFARSDSLSSLSDHSDDSDDSKPANHSKPAKAAAAAKPAATRRKSPPRAKAKDDGKEDKKAAARKSPVKRAEKAEKVEKAVKSPPRSRAGDATEKKAGARKSPSPKGSRSPPRAKAQEPASKKPEPSSRSPRRVASSSASSSSSSASASGEEYPFLDMKYVIAHTKGYEELKVELRKTAKGVSMFARAPFKKGSTIAYYKLKIIKERSKKPRVKGGIYTFSIYDKQGEKIKTLTGDLCDESLEQPRRGVPFFAYFAKEPTGKQTCNAFMDDSLKDNYKDREEVNEGDFFTYRLMALRDVPEGEEICWYYGDHYQRDYKVSDCSR